MEKLITYSNGLRLIVNNIPTMRSVSTGFWVGVGGAKESSDINGLSHFTEHMMFKGTDKLCANDIANAFENLGANINAFTSKECTCYYVKSIDAHKEECFRLLAHIFLDSTFPDAELDKERKVILEEINMVEDSPEDICFDMLAKSLYGDTKMGQTILGSIENVKRFAKKDVDKFISEYYCSDNVVISIAGNISLSEADNYVKKYILPKICENASHKGDMAEYKSNKNYCERIKDFEQSNIAIGFPSLKFNHEKNNIQAVTNMILGGGMSSRLFQLIREQLGLAYSVYTAPSAYKNNGSFNIVMNISVENTQKALMAAKNVIDDICKNGVTMQELLRAKTQLKSACVFSMENPQTVMLSSGKLLIMSNEVYDIDKKIADIDRVTLDEVSAFSCDVFNSDNACCAYVGKKHDVDFGNIF